MKTLLPACAPPSGPRARLALAFSLVVALPFAGRGQGVGIGTTAPAASAALEVAAPDKGLLIPRLDSAQRVGIVAPATGLLVFQTSPRPGFYYYGGAGWLFLADKTRTGDNLGNHTATQNLNLQGNALTGTGADIGAAVGVGVRADGGLNLGQNTTGNSVYLGYQAGQASTGIFNQFSGYQSGYSNTTAGGNQFSGLQSGYNNTTGSNNQFSGILSGYSNTEGSGNQFNGHQSGARNTTGNNNQFNGIFSGHNNTTGSNNQFNGNQSGFANTEGSRNQFSGYLSGSSNTTGNNNQFSGYLSGVFTTTGSNNQFSGYRSGFYNAGGSNNWAFGYNSGPTTGNLTNAGAIGYQAQVSQSNSLVLGGTGADAVSVGIGTTAPAASAALEIAAPDKGLLIPRLDSAQRVGIVAPATGLLVFQTSPRPGFYYYGGAGWLFLADKTRTGDNLGNHTATQNLNLADKLLVGQGGSQGLAVSGSGRVGIGTTGPTAPLEVLAGTALTGSNTGTETLLRLTRPGTSFAKWNSSAELALGTYAAGINSQSQLDFRLGNGFSDAADQTVLTLRGDGRVGLGTTAPRGQLDVAGSGDTYLMAEPGNGSGQSVYLPGHLYLAPYSGASGTAYVQARVPSPTTSTSIGLTLRTTNGTSLVDALRLNPDGSAVFAGAVTANGVTLTSDARFKQDVRPLTGALAGVLALRGVRYRWNALGVQHGGAAGAGQLGLLAQEVEAIYPELVRTDAEGYKSVNYAQLTPVLLEAIRELAAQNQALQTQVSSLQTQQASLLRLEQRMRAIEAAAAQAAR